jgi:Flp pilus assembly protein TadB
VRLTATTTSVLVALLAITPMAGLAAVPAGAATARKAATTGANEARLGRGFGRSSRPTFGSRRPSVRRPTVRRPIRRRPLFRHGFFGSVLRALGIAYLVHLMFGWGAGGGSPLGLLLVIGFVVWLMTRRRRRRPAYW